jgi:alpha-tubulin suppressor-like RCC1 family protein
MFVFSKYSRPATAPRRSLPAVLIAVLGIAALGGCGHSKVTAAATTAIDSTVTSVVMSPSVATLALGDSLRLSAVEYNTNQVLVTTDPVIWSTSDSSVAVVSDSGTVRGRSAGTATITATAGKAAGTAAITITAPTTQPLASLTSVSSGFSHTCAIGANDAAWCWGSNEWGQLGNDTTVLSPLPIAVSGGQAFASITAGYAHTCALTAGGTAYCWGDDEAGELGNGVTGGKSGTPVAVTGGYTFKAISAGYAHTCGITTAGAAYCWGANESNELGDTTAGDQSAVPVPVAGGLTFASISAGAVYTCGVTTTGAGYCWGSNGYGVLGDGTTTDHATPVAVAGGLDFATIAAGVYHTCGLTTTGVAYCWGNPINGQLGTGFNSALGTTPQIVAGGLSFAAISVGELSSCAVTTGGAAYCWGSGSFGALGNGASGQVNVPQPVTGSTTFANLSGGLSFHMCALTTAGGAYCWGYNDSGELGDATAGGFSETPQQVVVPIGQ